MKPTLKITLIILSMFIVTQLIGLYVVNFYSPIKVVDGKQVQVEAPSLPLGLETPEVRTNWEFTQILISIIISFVIAILIIFFLTKFKVTLIMRIWFLIVVTMALTVVFRTLIPLKYSTFIALGIAVPLAIIKIFKRNFFVHNFTELFIYPGIAAIFVPILNIWTVFIFLVLISIYDLWAVWKSGIMQKMAKFNINELKIFPGFFIPSFSKNQKMEIEKFKKMPKLKTKGKKMKVNIAILGGGDIFFPLVAAGVLLKTFGFVSSLFVVAGAVIGLGYLLLIGEKKKFYPAMPFITAGIFAMLLIFWLLKFFIF